VTEISYPPDAHDGSLNSALANAVVQLVREYTGRGPTRARATVAPELISVHMADVLTKAERKLVERGKADLVCEIRRQFQRTMREDLIGEVERLSGRKVVAFMSDQHIDPDMAIEAFIMEPAAVDGDSPR
jgi:uncharacterized protein YbcI